MIIRAILGLKLREACALRWQHIREDRIAIRQVYRGLPPRGSRPVNDQEHRDVPMPQIVGRFLLKLRKLAKFKRDEDFVFANVSGRNPVDSSDIMRKFLGPAAVSCGLPRRSVGKLERTCRLITKEHGLSFEFQRDVLRIHQRHQPYTQRDFKDTLAVLDECVAFVGLDKLMNEWNQEEDTVGAARPGALKKGKVVDQKERAKLSADRRPRITAFVAEKNRAAEEESRPRISNNAVYRVAGCSEADGRQWLDGWWPDSSVKSNRIEKVLSGETRFIDPGRGKIVDPNERAKLSADRRPRLEAFVAEKNCAAEQEGRPRISNNAVYRVAGCSEADGKVWLYGWWPDSSVKSGRIEKVLSGETRFIDPGPKPKKAKKGRS